MVWTTSASAASSCGASETADNDRETAGTEVRTSSSSETAWPGSDSAREWAYAGGVDSKEERGERRMWRKKEEEKWREGGTSGCDQRVGDMVSGCCRIGEIVDEVMRRGAWVVRSVVQRARH